MYMIQDFGTATTTGSAGATKLLLVHWKNLLGNGCLLLFGTFAILTDYCRNFLSRWASHWLTRELKKVTLKRAWGPRDSDSRATMWFLWVKKRPLYPPIGTNLSQFLAGWGKRGQKHLNLLVWLLPTTQHGFDYQLFAWLAKKLISPTT